MLQTGAECIRFRWKWGCNLQSAACVSLSSRRRLDPSPHPHPGSFCMWFESYRNHNQKVTWITSNQFLRLSMQRFVTIKSLFSDMAFRKTQFDRIRSSRHLANCRGTRVLKMLYKFSTRTMAIFAVCIWFLYLPCKWCLKSGRDVSLEYQEIDIFNQHLLSQGNQGSTSQG